MTASWPVYVINMSDNAARMQKCRAALAAQGIAFERFEAVNGRALTPGEIAGIYDPAANRRKFRHPLVAGELGCYLSHIALWRKLVASDAPGAVLLEDDFAASPGLGDVLAALADDAGDWDMVKLFSRRPGARMLARRPLCDGFDLAVPYQIPNTTLGYVIRRDAAAALLENALPVARPIDEDHKRFWEHGLKITLVQPPPLTLGEEASKGDTIQANRKAATRPPLGAVLGQGVRNLGYRLRYLAALHFHRLKMAERAWRHGLGKDISSPDARAEARRHFLYIDHGVLRVWWRNFHEIAPGAYRANQPSPERLAEFRDMGIKTILNLRGESEYSPYLFEAEACATLGLTLIDHRLYAAALASRDELLELIAIFRRIEKPFVMHCKSGSDRTGFAAILYLHIIEGQPLAQAMRQLNWRHLHFRKSKNGILDLFFEAYLEAASDGTPSLEDWIRSEYDPAVLNERFAAERGRG